MNPQPVSFAAAAFDVGRIRNSAYLVMLRMMKGKNTRPRGSGVGVAVGVADGVAVAVGVGAGVSVGVGVGVSVGVAVGVAVGVSVGVGVLVGGGAQDSDQASNWGEALPSVLLRRAASRSDGYNSASIALKSAPLPTSAMTSAFAAFRISTRNAVPLGMVDVKRICPHAPREAGVMSVETAAPSRKYL